ncbi:tRNA-dihydrouridine synthase family protein [Candidatus Kaiserbacteria bacterium]|nr:tRNA-dihydrouridine synthase family protein [Candidatus Kaiserbacteria bacterium]
MKSFWQELPKPFFAMAPMADVTDVAFRALVAKRCKPDIFWTEFVSADGLYHTREIAKMKDEENPLMRDLQFTEEQRPIVAQIFSSKPEMIAYATKLVVELGPTHFAQCGGRGFDGVDINMGCPDRAIEKQGAGAALVKNSALAQELILAAKKAVQELPKSSYRTDLVVPVSVKTRVGYNEESLDEWLPALLSANPAAITLHLRTRKEMSLVPAGWELMKKAVEIRNKINPNVLLIGNGDVQDLEDARTKAVETGCDGIMLGRAMFGNPWVFAGRKIEDTPLAEKLAALVELAHNFEKLSPPKNFAILKKHIKAFVAGFAGAADLRVRLMSAHSASELEAIIAQNKV